MLNQEEVNNSVAEDKAKILGAVFGKKTSIVYDAKAIVDVFCKED